MAARGRGFAKFSDSFHCGMVREKRTRFCKRYSAAGMAEANPSAAVPNRLALEQLNVAEK